MRIKTFVSNIFKRSLTVISPKLNTSVLFQIKKHRRINLKHPETFEEKLLKIKLENYNNNSLVKQCADKYRVREYVERLGYGFMLNRLYGVFDSFDEIDPELLPRSFALKLNTGCGCNYICKDKSEIDYEILKSLVRSWMKYRPWLDYAELQYKGVAKKLLVEEYLSDESGKAPEDYKIYCFNGQPLAVLYIGGRFSNEIRAGFFDTQWRYLGIKRNDKKHYTDFDEDCYPPKPVSLNRMIEAAAKLSAGFPFVRVDFFEVGGKPVFGEMTFTPAGGFDPAEVNINGKSMSEYL